MFIYVNSSWLWRVLMGVCAEHSSLIQTLARRELPWKRGANTTTDKQEALSFAAVFTVFGKFSP